MALAHQGLLNQGFSFTYGHLDTSVSAFCEREQTNMHVGSALIFRVKLYTKYATYTCINLIFPLVCACLKME